MCTCYRTLFCCKAEVFCWISFVFPVNLSVGFPFQLIEITSAAGNGASLSVYQHLQPRTVVIYELHGVNGFVVADFYHSCFLLAEELVVHLNTHG